jgi:hypothetical protein
MGYSACHVLTRARVLLKGRVARPRAVRARHP